MEITVNSLGTGRDRLCDYMEIPEHHPERGQFGFGILLRSRNQQLPAGRYRNQNDSYRQKHKEQNHK